MENKLGNIAELKTGPFGTQLHASEYVVEGIPVINVKNIGYGEINDDDLDYVSPKTAERLSSHLLEEGDIVFGRKGSVDRHAYIDERFTGWMQGSDCIRVRCLNPEVNTKYLSHFFNLDYVKKQLLSGAVGSTMPSMNTDILKSLNIVLPEKKTQDDIEAVLSVINRKIDNNTEVCSDLESMAKLLYDYWFVQFDFPDENGKPYKSSGGKMVWNEELKREIPEGWEVKKLKGLYEIERGLSYSSKDIESGKGIPMINLACIDRSRNYRDGELKFHNGNVPKNAYLKAGDLLIACTDLTREREIIGCPILVPDDGKKYTYSMDIAKITFPSKDLNELYMYMALRTDYYHNYIKSWASGTNVLHLNLEGLDWYKTCIPPIELQDKFSNLIRSIHAETSSILSENQQLTSLRDFLLPMLMNGQVKVGKEGS